MQLKAIDIPDRYRFGMTVDAKITSVKPFGAFLAFEPGVEGLCLIPHLRRCTGGDTPAERCYSVGEVIRVRIVAIDRRRGQLGASEKAADWPRELFDREFAWAAPQWQTLGP